MKFINEEDREDAARDREAWLKELGRKEGDVILDTDKDWEYVLSEDGVRVYLPLTLQNIYE